MSNLDLKSPFSASTKADRTAERMDKCTDRLITLGFLLVSEVVATAPY